MGLKMDNFISRNVTSPLTSPVEGGGGLYRFLNAVMRAPKAN